MKTQLVLIKFTVEELARMALMLWRSEGISLDEVRQIGRATFVHAYASCRDEDDWTGPCVPPTDEEIGAMYDRAVWLWAHEQTLSVAVH